MHRSPRITIADRIGEARAERARLVEQLGTLIREDAPAAAIVECSSKLRAAGEKLADLETEKAVRDATSGEGYRHTIPPPMKISRK